MVDGLLALKARCGDSPGQSEATPRVLADIIKPSADSAAQPGPIGWRRGKVELYPQRQKLGRELRKPSVQVAAISTDSLTFPFSRHYGVAANCLSSIAVWRRMEYSPLSKKTGSGAARLTMAAAGNCTKAN